MAELYLFEDNGNYITYTDGFLSTTYLGRTYTPTAIKRSKLNITDNLSKATITISLPRNNLFAKRVLTVTPELAIKVKIIKSSVVQWQGIITKSKASFSTIDLICESEWAAFLKSVNTYNISPLCQHQLYSPQCGVVELVWRVTYTDVSVSSTVIDIPTLTEASGYFNNGSIEFKGEKRRILKQVGTTLNISSAFMSSGIDTVFLSPGCNLTEENCKLFSNLPNHLGFARIPHKNPFNSTGLL